MGTSRVATSLTVTGTAGPRPAAFAAAASPPRSPQADRASAAAQSHAANAGRARVIPVPPRGLIAGLRVRLAPRVGSPRAQAPRTARSGAGTRVSGTGTPGHGASAPARGGGAS